MESVKSFPPNPTSESPASPPPPQNYVQSIDLIISDYMERLGTRLNILETELKYAWRALDLLSQEYIKMWERLEKLEVLLYEQQSVIAQLLDFYTVMGSTEGSAEERAAIGQAVEEGLASRETADDLAKSIQDLMKDAAANSEAHHEPVGPTLADLAITGSSSTAAAIISELQLEMGMDESIHMPDEAFYRSLNNAYRDDLVGSDTGGSTSSQLGMIWEEAEEGDEVCGAKDTTREDARNEVEETQEVFSALDYKDYRGNSPCVSEQDLAQLTRLSVIDQVALEKLQELDRLTSKLQKDSKNLKELQDRLLESPQHQFQHEENAESLTARSIAGETSVIDEQLRQIYVESELENWSFSNSAHGISELMLVAGGALPSGLTSKSRPSSRLSTDSGGATDSEVASALSGLRSSVSPTSPRHRVLLEASSSICNTGMLSAQTLGRLGFSSSELLRADITSSCAYNTSPKASSERYDLGAYSADYTDRQGFLELGVTSYSHTSPTAYPSTSENIQSPTLSVCSLRTRQDGYIDSSTRLGLELTETRMTPSPSPTSPPPPAPRDSTEMFLMPSVDMSHRGTSPTAGTTSITSPSSEQQQGRLSPHTPHSPKSPRLSPKNIVKSTSANIGTAKSDSGLSSMSGWSSMEKSPGSPKGAITCTKAPITSPYTADSISRVHLQQQHHHLATSPLAPPIHMSSSSSISPQDVRQMSATTTDHYPYTTMQPSFPTMPAGLLPSGIHPSAFTTVKSPTSLDSSTPSITGESSGNFVPSPAPSSDVSVSPKGRSQRILDFHQHSPSATTTMYGDFMYRSEQPAIYSVAGSNRQQSFTSVYTSGTSSYAPRTSGSTYPDLVEPCNNKSNNQRSPSYRYQSDQERTMSRSHSTSSYPIPTTTPVQHSSKKSLSRGHSTGSATPGVAHMEGYKTAMYRTMFPTGNITDALSYYPTNTQYESGPQNGGQPRGEYPHGSQWVNTSQPHMEHIGQMKHDHTSSSLRSMENAPSSTGECMYGPGPYMDPRRYPQHPHSMQSITPDRMADPNDPYNREYMWNQRPDMQYLDLDLRKRNAAAEHQAMMHHEGQYYDPSSVIVSQSGYISISADIKDSNVPPEEKISKKGKLKSAMSSVSSWLPDLHLSKRHRSHSLPAGVRREDLAMSKEQGRTRNKVPHPTTTMPRKKKKNPLVSTMSGILQKAKRRSQHHSQSMSDPEQSETEWSGRTSAVSEDSEDSVFSDAPTDIFAKVSHGMTRQLSLQQQHVLTGSSGDKTGNKTESEMEQMSDLPYDTGAESQTPADTDSSSIFATVGEVKRVAPTSSDESTAGDGKHQFPPVALGGASREFAVSRALGKYRQRQSSTVSEEQMIQDGVMKPEDIVTVITQDEESSNEDTKSVSKSIEEIDTVAPQQPPVKTEEHPMIQGSPSVSSMRSFVSRHHPPRHQQSLELPYSRGTAEVDDDCRSTHSWRSTSRVSSRRQSTEDSIDSEDEWYCYELRKLEEMERQSLLEPEREPGQQDQDTEPFEPNQNVKEQMSFVLQELRLKAQTREGVFDKEDQRQQIRARAAGTMFWEEGHVAGNKDFAVEPVIVPQPPPVQPDKEPVQPVRRRLVDDDGSSGETSGPDSPNRSMGEIEEDDDAAMETELERSIRSSSASTLRQGEKALQGSDSLSREGSVSVPPSEMSVSIPASEGWDSEETATVREGSVSIPASEWEGEGETREGGESSLDSSIPKIKFDPECYDLDDPGGKDSGPMGSKWKLLKALKERKAEEKIQEAATTAEAATTTTTVSLVLSRGNDIVVAT